MNSSASVDVSFEAVEVLALEQHLSDVCEAALEQALLKLLIDDMVETPALSLVAAGDEQTDRRINDAVVPILTGLALGVVSANIARKARPKLEAATAETLAETAKNAAARAVKTALAALRGKKSLRVRENSIEKTYERTVEGPKSIKSWAKEAAATMTTVAVEEVKAEISTKIGFTHKIWDTMLDNRVRPEHRALEGVRVKIDEDFVTPLGVHLSRPGDPTAPLDEIIQCRCRLRYEFDASTTNIASDIVDFYGDEHWTEDKDEDK